jgi:hypothetical protein
VVIDIAIQPQEREKERWKSENWTKIEIFLKKWSVRDSLTH